MPISDDRRMINILRLATTTATLLTATVTIDHSTTSGASPETTAVLAAPSGSTVELDRELSRPHVLDTPVGEVIVRVRGSALCSGTPLTGTKFVVTAAHCVLDENGAIDGHTRVLRDGVVYTPVSVLVNPEYHSSPSPLLDAAVLVMDHIISGPSATLADRFPTEGLVTVAGFQPLDTDGSLLRGTRVGQPTAPRRRQTRHLQDRHGGRRMRPFGSRRGHHRRPREGAVRLDPRRIRRWPVRRAQR